MSTPLFSLSSFARGALRRLPVETAVIGGVVATLISLLHAGHSGGPWPGRLLVTSLLALPLAFALHEHPRTRASAARLGVALFALLGVGACLVIEDGRALDRPAVQWPLVLFTAAAYLTPFVVAAPRFFPFVRRFFEEVTTWALLGAMALAAIFITGYAVQALFGVRTEVLCLDAALLTAGAFTLIVLERLLPDRAATGKVPELWRRLATAIGAPFVSAMLVILVVYELSVLVRGELPSNLLSPLLIGAGFVGYLCTLIITAVAAEPVGTGALSPADPHRFLRDRSVQLARAFPIALLLLLPMALWAVVVRVEQYGFTPFRVVRLAAVLCLMALSVLGTLRWLRGRAPLGWHVPAAVLTFALIISAGPLGAVELSIRSQAARLEQLLDDSGVETRTVQVPPPAPRLRLAGAQWWELQAALDDLAALGGEPAMRRVLVGEVATCGHRWAADECLRGLGVAPEGRDGDALPTKYATLATEAPVAVPAGRVTFVTAGFFDPRYRVDGATLRLACDPAGATDHAPAWAVASLSHLVTVAAIEGSPRQPLPPRPLALHAEGDCQLPGTFVVRVLEAESTAGEVQLRSVEGVWIR
jgi:hypothetical protein